MKIGINLNIIKTSKVVSKQIYILLILLSSASMVHAQVHEFSVHIGNKEIGSIHAKRVKMDDKEIYNVVSNATFRVVWKYHRTTDMVAIYANDMLHSSISKIVMNNDVKEHSEFWKDGNGYKCHTKDKIEKKEKVIHYSSVKLYFEEPTDIDSVYSETFLEMSYLENLGDSRYKLFLPGNRENTYSYHNGELHEVKVDRTIDILFTRKSE